MLVMETILKIRVSHRKGDSVRKISKDLRLSRNTVRKFLKIEEVEVPRYKKESPNYAKLGPYLKKIEELVIENMGAKKQRQKRALYEDLKNMGCKGSYSAVCRQARKIELEHREDSCSQAFVPLKFESGEAYQFDWSTQHIQIGKAITEVKVAHFVLCYSRRKYTRAYYCEKQEMVFDAHVRAFDFYEGVSQRGIYDNMKTAVKKILKGKEREWNPSFERMCAHYRIEPVACNPASGWEKGQVERQVRVDEGRFFTPIPKVNSLEEFNEQLLSQVIMYNRTKQHPTFKEKTIEEVYEEEKKNLIHIPLQFDAMRSKEVKVSSTCLAMFDRNQYSVDCRYAGKNIHCNAYADKLLFICQGKQIASHPRYFTRGKIYYNWQHYLPVLKRKPGALRNGAPFENMELPGSLETVQRHFQRHTKNTNRFAQLLSYIPQTSLKAVEDACQKAIADNVINYEVIVNYLFRSADTVREEKISDIPHYLTLTFEPVSNCYRYNQLLKVSVQ